MSNQGSVDKTINHVVIYDGKEYRRYKNDGYYVLYPVVDGKVDYSTSTVEHRLIYEMYHNIKLPSDMQVHHVNHDRSDNRPENLVALSTSEHARLHAIELGYTVGPSYCKDCGKPLQQARILRCRKCADNAKRLHIPSREELEKYVEMSNAAIGKIYGVTGLTISKWRKLRNLPPSPYQKA